MSKSKIKLDSGEVVEGHLPRRASYPWETWSDGKQRRLTRGKHYFTESHVFATAVYNHCRRHNASSKKPKLEARCQTEDADHVLIQIIKIVNGSQGSQAQRLKSTDKASSSSSQKRKTAKPVEVTE